MKKYHTVSDIRSLLRDELLAERFVTDKSGVKTIELVGVSFNADQDHVFGEVNEEYVKRETEWYESQSLKVGDIPGGPPEIWKAVASKNGTINSNYGFLIYSYDNYSQYANVVEELKRNPLSRRACMIYTRPSMHYDYNRDGMSDFVCTHAVNYLIRDGRLNAVVQMRSNDAIFGYRNDRAWQDYVLRRLAADLMVEPGEIIWNASSFHVYERHFYLVAHWHRCGATTVKKVVHDELHPGPEGWKISG